MITTETMLARKSVRTYDGRPIQAETLQKLKAYGEGIETPFGVPVRFVYLDAKEKGLSSPVLTGEPMYVAGKVDKVPYGEVALGCAMEELLLYAWSLGLGSVWIGGTMKRALFEQAAAVGAGERMPCVSPLGYPAAKMSLRETVMRRGVGADSRLPGEKLFFDGVFSAPLAGKAPAPWGELLELVRWAPSAVNKQPWRLVLQGERVHFYLRHDKGYVSEAVGDMQKIDMGIALCHLLLGLRALGRKAAVSLEDPSLAAPEGVEYIASVFI